MDKQRSEDNEKSSFYEQLAECIKNNDKFENTIDDRVSHWILKLAFIEIDKGNNVMYEGFIFTGRLLN